MLISGGIKGVKCNIFVSTLIGTTLEYFNTLLTRIVKLFRDFSKIFVVQFVKNKSKSPKISDIFNVKQYSVSC